MRVAIPTNKPGGIDATRAGHFGHCDVFTVVELDDNGKVAGVETLINHGHEAGGCMTPVNLLQTKGVEAIVVAGLGMRPMQGFAQAGITVFYADQSQITDVTGVIENLREKKLVVMHADQACKGSGNCQH